PRRRAPLHEDRRRARARPEGERRLRDRLRVAGEERQLEPDEAAVPDPLQRVDLVQEERRRILVTVPARYGPHQEDRAVLGQRVTVPLPDLAESQDRRGTVEVLDREPAPLAPGATRDLPVDRRDHTRELDLLITEVTEVARVHMVEEPDLLTELLQRMAADEEAQDLLLAGEALGLAPRLDIREDRLRAQLRRRVGAAAQRIEERALARLALRGAELRLAERALEAGQELRPVRRAGRGRGRQRVTRAGRDQRFERPAARHAQVDPVDQIEERAERAVARPGVQDRADRRLAHAPDRAQPEPDLRARDRRELPAGLVHIRRQDL